MIMWHKYEVSIVTQSGKYLFWEGFKFSKQLALQSAEKYVKKQNELIARVFVREF
jgi:hypothetical protein